MTTPDFATSTARRIQGLLMPGEEVRYAARRHWLSYQRAFTYGLLAVFSIALTLLLREPGGPYFLLFSGVNASSIRILAEYAALFFLLATLGSALTTAVLNYTLIMAVTSRRLILRLGLIARDTTDIPLSKIDIVMIDQTIMDRLTGGGSVIVRTVSEATTSFRAVREPTAFRNAIIAAMEGASQQNPSVGSGKAG